MNIKPVRLIDLTKPEIDYLFEHITALPEKPLIDLTVIDLAAIKPEGYA